MFLTIATVDSRTITSSQTGIHTDLTDYVRKHAATTFRKPIAQYNQQAFDSVVRVWDDAGRPPLILDTGCGVGLSTRHLAQQFPGHFVMGVDQSADRLSRNTHWEGDMPANMVLVRADLVDFWRLVYDAGIRPDRHYFLYPNPWPKIGHLQRRWQGHAVFPVIVALGGYIECRSNWAIYAHEFAHALQLLSGQDVVCETYQPDTIMTPFERKYLASGHTLWRCRTQLPPR